MIRPVEGLEQSFAGNNIVITGYNIKYSYEVYGKRYTKDMILGHHADRFVNLIIGTEYNFPVEVYYKINDPVKSYLNTDPNPDYCEAIARQAKNHE